MAPLRPVSLCHGERFAAVFDDGTDIDGVRATPLPADTSCYAIVYAATHVRDGVETDALVAEVGDLRSEYGYGVDFSWIDGQAVPHREPLRVWSTGPTRLATVQDE